MRTALLSMQQSARLRATVRGGVQLTGRYSAAGASGAARSRQSWLQPAARRGLAAPSSGAQIRMSSSLRSAGLRSSLRGSLHSSHVGFPIVRAADVPMMVVVTQQRRWMSGDSKSGKSGAVSKSAAAPPPARWTPSWVWIQLKDTAMHYWHGSKLLYTDTRIAAKLLRRMAVGRTLSRREHNLLVRVFADIARLVPLSFFVLVPMMEFALPFAIRLFPNLLPSTFEEKHHKAEQHGQNGRGGEAVAEHHGLLGLRPKARGCAPHS